MSKPTKQDVIDYGYTYDGMTIATYQDAVNDFEKYGEGVFLLYPDDTEALATNIKEIHEHGKNGGIFGFDYIERI